MKMHSLPWLRVVRDIQTLKQKSGILYTKHSAQECKLNYHAMVGKSGSYVRFCRFALTAFPAIPPNVADSDKI